MDVLQRHVALFNQGVQTGNFGPMVDRITDDPELVFQNIPVRPFHGRDAIAAAYASQPPDDENVILGSRQVGDVLVAAYARASEPTTHVGDMVITADSDRIARLLVVYGGHFRDSG